MKKFRKFLAVVLVLAILGASGAGALNYIKKSHETEILVVPVEALASDYYTQDTILEGMVTTNVSQNIGIDRDMIVDEIYVQEGQEVSIGDPLVSFDMTLVEMELNIARLKHEQMGIDMAKAVKRLNSLKNGGPIYENTSGADLDADSMDGEFGIIEGFSIRGWNQGGFSFASVISNSILAAAESFEDFSDEFSDDFASEEEMMQPEEEEETDLPTGDDFADDFVVDDEVADEWEMNPSLDKNDDFYETDIVFYDRLDGLTIPFTGTGTEEDPFVFLCTSGVDAVIAEGSFLNVMAGYNAAGTELLHEGGYWYQLEFHNGDEVLDTEERMKSCSGYFLVDGGLLEEPVYPYAEMEYLKEMATPVNPEWGGGEGGWGQGGGSGIGDGGMTRAEAIRLQERRVNTLKINMEESSINIGKLERKVQNQIVYARLDGIVAKVGNEKGNSGGNLMTIKSKKGYYVTGTISELLLDQMQEGTKLSCMSYQMGNFDATVLEVADYPMDSNEYGYYGGDSNPNVSYYKYSAEIDDQSLQMRDGDWLQVTMKAENSGGKKLVLSKAFVRSENGRNYVYKEEDGVLKKQYVKVGGNVDYGYSVIIQAGLTRKDYISFPYGKEVKDGVKTRRGTIEEFYGY